MKSNSFFYVTSYYRSIIAILASLGLIFYCVSEMGKKIDDYPKVSGVIVKAHLFWNRSPFTVCINSQPKQWYDIYPEKYYPILKEKVIPGKQAIIWYSPKNNRIKKLVVEGEELKPYEKSIGVYIGFLIAGVLLLIVNFLYILRNPSHAKGKPEDN